MLAIRLASVATITCAVFAVVGCSNSTSGNPTNAAIGGTNATGGETSNAGSSAVAGNTSAGGAGTGGGSAQCTASQKRCSNVGVPQTCNAGKWQDATACTGQNYCSAGSCVACGGTDGPTMVALQEAGFCVDSTEVTRAQYKKWLDTSPATGSQGTSCTWNTAFAPSDPGWPYTTSTNFPVRGVDWCDAYAYCAAVGKRLCGKISGGANTYADYAATTGQWLSACSSNGRYLAYPYGTNYSKPACNGTDYPLDAGTHDVFATGSLSTCQSSIAGYTGVFDMSGNVQEWEDSCDETSSTVPDVQRCRLRGGSYLSSFEKLTCNGDFFSFRSYTSLDTGFRCCSR